MLAAIKFFLGQDEAEDAGSDDDEDGGGSRKQESGAATPPAAPSSKEVYAAKSKVGTQPTFASLPPPKRSWVKKGPSRCKRCPLQGGPVVMSGGREAAVTGTQYSAVASCRDLTAVCVFPSAGHQLQQEEEGGQGEARDAGGEEGRAAAGGLRVRVLRRHAAAARPTGA